MNQEQTYNDNEIQNLLNSELPDWSYENNHLCRSYGVNGWKSSLMLTCAIGHLAEIAWHHPDIQVSYGKVTVQLMTHSAGGITDKDFQLAKKIEQSVAWSPGDDPGSALTGTPDDDRYQYIK